MFKMLKIMLKYKKMVQYSMILKTNVIYMYNVYIYVLQSTV